MNADGLGYDDRLSHALSALNSFDVHRAMADLEWADNHCTGATVRAMLLRQCTTLGMRGWNTSYPLMDFEATSRHVHIAAYVFTADQGGDEQGSHTIPSNELLDIPNVLYFRQWCLQHQGQLETKALLRRLGEDFWKSLSSICYTCRANHAEIVNGFRATYGDAVANKCWPKLVPRPPPRSLGQQVTL